MHFELDRHVAAEASGPGRYAVHLHEGWVVGSGVNGGYLLAVVGNAVRTHLAGPGGPGHTEPLTSSAYYLTASVPGPAEVHVETLRTGRTRSTVAASLVQEGPDGEVERIRVLTTYAAPAAGGEGAPEVERQVPVPDLPPVEDCLDPVASAPDPDQVPPLMRRLGTRLDPASAGWAVGRPSGRGVIQGWFALADDRPLDSLALLLAVDSLPPATFDLGLMGWAPTLELTVHVRGVPAPGWAVVRHETRNVSGGCFEEDCHVWDSRGVLVAQSRQLALLPR